MMLMVSVGVITMGVITSTMDAPKDSNEFAGKSAMVGVLMSSVASASEAVKTVYSQIMMAKLSLFDGIYWASPSFVALAVVFVGALEMPTMRHFEWSAPLVLCLAGNAFLTGLIVLSTFWFVKLVGALTVKVVTQARSIGLILFAVYFCGDWCSSQQYVGYGIALIGIGLFDLAKQR